MISRRNPISSSMRISTHNLPSIKPSSRPYPILKRWDIEFLAQLRAKKSSFCQHELEYLGHWITRECIQPLPNKVAAIRRIAQPKTKKGLRSFIGMVNYYRDSWIRRSHLLSPLTELAGKKSKQKCLCDVFCTLLSNKITCR